MMLQLPAKSQKFQYALQCKVIYGIVTSVILPAVCRRPTIQFVRISEVRVSQIAPLPLSVQIRNRSRSMGVKLLVVSFLALLMAIPAIFVNSIVDDRTGRAKDVIQEISTRVGGQQIFLGPVLAIPYSIPPAFKGASAVTGEYVVFPSQGDATVKVRTEERHRSLFKVPVYQADLKFDAAFDLAGVPSAAPADAVLDWSRAAVVIGVSNAHGALADGTLTMNGKTATLMPAENISDPSSQTRLPLTYFGARAGDVAHPEAAFRVGAALRFSGAQSIAVLPFAKTSHVTMEGDWPSPSFDGAFLPTKRTVSRQGFTGEWLVPFIARGVRSEGTNLAVGSLDSAALGVTFVEVADPYQSVLRSLKYVALFVGLIFLSYFVFEATAHKRVHPAQYVLVGIAQMIFYLLLLSFAERIGFDWAFLLAGAATVVLLSVNANWIFHSRLQGVRAMAVFSLLYFFIYLLLRLEDNALLVGAAASFLAIAAVMHFTRNLDWYSSMASGDESRAVEAPH
jgi:inner membrane protein